MDWHKTQTKYRGKSQPIIAEISLILGTMRLPLLWLINESIIRNMREPWSSGLEDCWQEEQEVLESSLSFHVWMFTRRLTWGLKLLKSHPKRYKKSWNESKRFQKPSNFVFRFSPKTQWQSLLTPLCITKWRMQSMRWPTWMTIVDQQGRVGHGGQLFKNW